MNVIGKIKSWNKSNDKDCFGFGAPCSKEYIYPNSKGGSSNEMNMQVLSEIANKQKKDLTKGKIGAEWRFSILKQTDKDGGVFGVMFIRNKNWNENEWKEVVSVI